ncbi:MAG: hypothetical protein MO852_06170 [Candidatus Devosia euplotis]|nr:hypothetical protein [Candidatus Devosia euplotis]
MRPVEGFAIAACDIDAGKVEQSPGGNSDKNRSIAAPISQVSLLVTGGGDNG